ncbi:MAG: SPFH domain-containing protein [Planctomycetes bacterium]|nr:SPFH domain-containing protein [Planctomycetota bacterium]
MQTLMLAAAGGGAVVGVLFALFLVAALFVLATGLFQVKQQERAIIERFGRLLRVARPGLNLKLPAPIDTIAARISNRMRELEIKIESKTKDDVFVDLLVAVQFLVRDTDEAVAAAHYKLANPMQQISSYVFDTVRALVPEMPIDSVFSEKDRIAQAVKERLAHTMQEFGYTIVQALVNDIQPDAEVKKAMNKVNASARLREAARNEAEAQKIRVIAEAEAEARAKELQGVGIARQRLAIAKGLKESVEACSEAGISPEEATRMVLLTQHYDTVQAVGARSKSTVMMVPYAPTGMSTVAEQITQAMLLTNNAGDNLAERSEPKPGEPSAPRPPTPRPPKGPGRQELI